MLTQEEKNQVIDRRLKEYDLKMFNLELDVAALEAAGDGEGVAQTAKRIESLQKAKAAIDSMKVQTDAGS